MTIFDLLFILVFLATVALLIVIIIQALCGRRKRASRMLCFLGIGLFVYFFVVAVVAITAPQRIIAQAQSRCFDEMCFAVKGVGVASTLGKGQQITRARGKFYIVTIQVSCRGHGRAQSEAGVGVSLVDAEGSTYEVSPAGQHAHEIEHGITPPLTAHVAPGETVTSIQVFDVPVGTAADIGLHISHSGPGLFIIGDDESPLHKPTIIRLYL